MKLKSNRFAVAPVMCYHCKRYIWMEPYRSGRNMEWSCGTVCEDPALQ